MEDLLCQINFYDNSMYSFIRHVLVVLAAKPNLCMAANYTNYFC